MSDIAAQLEELQRQMRELHAWRREADRAGLLQRLGEGPRPGQVRIGAEPGPRPRFAAGSPFDTLGNTQPWQGLRNVISDPLFEDFQSVSPVDTTENATGSWFEKYVLNSGTAPTTRNTSIQYQRGDTADNPFSSNDATLHVTAFPAGASDVTFYTRAKPFSPVNVPTQPYLVGALRVAQLIANVFTGITTCDVSLEILSGATPTTLEAESHVLNWLTHPYGEGFQLVAAVTHTAADWYLTSWWWRLKVHIVGSGSGGNVNVDFGEPQFHFAPTPDAMPFQPAIGTWLTPTPSTSGFAASQTLTAATDTISVPTLGTLVQPFTASAPLTMTSTPTIPDGFDGQQVIYLNRGANGITVQDEVSLASSNLKLGVPTVSIGVGQSRMFLFDEATGFWYLQY